ncbi:hypothetical protein ACFQL1_14910 [Halomicroarcula sp. GCM10025709]|uniref:DUF7289 family protein n=1 Tax=Haloarcula TaxID=2237 RepID=UPI0024C21188|nr:hypothetical protein [Halomicroarcula sp. YJ-61-S]
MLGDTPDSTRRAVSDLIAFTLVFSIIISSIGFLTVGGFTALEGVRDGAETNTAEATMVGYAETLADHRNERAPRRETTIKLQGHSLSRQSSSFVVDVAGVSGTQTISTGTLVRTTGSDTDLVYTSGAVFRADENGGVRVVRVPPFRCGTTGAHLSFVRVTGDINQSSSGRVTLRSQLRNRSLYFPDPSSGSAITTRVTVDVSGTEYRTAWERTFERYLEWSATGTPGVYECAGIDQAVVENTSIDIQAIS